MFHLGAMVLDWDIAPVLSDMTIRDRIKEFRRMPAAALKAFSNWRDRKKNGRSHPAKGERHGMAKLNERRVAEIKKAVSFGESSKIVAMRYGISYFSIRLIATGKTWKHISATE